MVSDAHSPFPLSLCPIYNTPVKTSGGGSLPSPLRVAMTVGEFYYGLFGGDKSLQCQPPHEVPPAFKCKKCTFSTKSNIG